MNFRRCIAARRLGQQQDRNEIELFRDNRENNSHGLCRAKTQCCVKLRLFKAL